MVHHLMIHLHLIGCSDCQLQGLAKPRWLRIHHYLLYHTSFWKQSHELPGQIYLSYRYASRLSNLPYASNSIFWYTLVILKEMVLYIPPTKRIFFGVSFWFLQPSSSPQGMSSKVTKTASTEKAKKSWTISSASDPNQSFHRIQKMFLFDGMFDWE